ncbi:hypothetical protein AB0D66_21665 [Streptomyces sp. NPDC048270]|uniref:hypothetical protein n=1 Tax=Streptomyces sp. NPDC048270 TaxID=3154615 RepID=UPI0033CBB3AB
MSGLQDSARLAAVVLLAKAPAASTGVRIRTGELARWLGCSASHVAHSVLPEMKAARVVTSRVLKDDEGQVTGLELHLEPLREARAEGAGHPLMLAKGDLATLLRLAEAVVGPGWAPVDGPVTPPGLLAGRQGRGAATDRLALLLLVLQTRADGRVRMVGGRVTAGRGRADATVARALKCSASGGAKVVDRLVASGVVHLARSLSTGAGFGRARLSVPAVAAAHARNAAALNAEPLPDQTPSTSGGDCPRCADGAFGGHAEAFPMSGDGWAQLSFDEAGEEYSSWRPVAASGVQEAAWKADGQAEGPSSGASGADEADGEQRYADAELHAPHAVVADVCVASADLSGFSGSAVGGCRSLPERVGAGEEQRSVTDGERVPSPVAGGPLRGEKPNKVSSAGKVVFVRPGRIPDDLVKVLEPVTGLWGSIGRSSSSRWAASAVRAEVERLRGVVGAEHALLALAGRLGRRLLAEEGRPIIDPVGWLMRRGLPQRAECWSLLCDDGLRMDSGAACASCDSLAGDRRALKAALVTAVACDLPHLPAGERRLETERRLHAQVQSDTAAALVRREQALVERAQRDVAVERRRRELAEEDRRRAAEPCRRCGTPEAAGLCLTCSYRQQTEVLVQDAIAVVVALRGELKTAKQVAEFWNRVESDTRGVIADRCAPVETQDAVVVAYTARWAAQELLDARRDAALARLERCEVAENEAVHAYRVALRRGQGQSSRAGVLEAADEAAERARGAAAQSLLEEFLGRLAGLREPEVLVGAA